MYRAALAAVDGRALVADHLRRHPLRSSFSGLAVGKAAAAMAWGLLDAQGGALRRLLVVTRHGHGGDIATAHAGLTLVEAGHPLPDAASLQAGRDLRALLDEMPPEESFVCLISGGASALLELPRPGVTLDELRRVNRWLLGAGLSIRDMNAVRCGLSTLKCGGLLRHLAGRRVCGLLISDVPGDDPAVIGSGLLAAPRAGSLPPDLPPWLKNLLARAQTGEPAPPPPAPALHILATNFHARQAAEAAARAMGYAVRNHDGLLTCEVAEAARRIAAALVREPGVLHLWGGEVSLRLPPRPGRGGRCQHLALMVARELRIQGRRAWSLLAAGSDGSDGPGEVAGALVDGGTLARARDAGLDVVDCLRRADAGHLLAGTGDLVVTGPTGTNVMDLVLGIMV
ncbi:MAG TPA: DUF4147 domain-containing protein [Gammaproteobacteria bacterium]|nr:DUF4147 domain-containing protein [Gammaproteobacteria bacterium]